MKVSALLFVIPSFDKSSVKATFINHFCEYDCILLVFPPIQSVFISFFHFYFDLFLLLPLFFYSYRFRPPSTQFPMELPIVFHPVPFVFHPIPFVFHPNSSLLSPSSHRLSPSPLRLLSNFLRLSPSSHHFIRPIFTTTTFIHFFFIQIGSNEKHLMCCK